MNGERFGGRWVGSNTGRKQEGARKIRVWGWEHGLSDSGVIERLWREI